MKSLRNNYEQLFINLWTIIIINGRHRVQRVTSKKKNAVIKFKIKRMIQFSKNLCSSIVDLNQETRIFLIHEAF